MPVIDGLIDGSLAEMGIQLWPRAMVTHIPWHHDTHTVAPWHTYRRGLLTHIPWPLDTHTVTPWHAYHDPLTHIPWHHATHNKAPWHTYRGTMTHIPWPLDTHTVTPWHTYRGACHDDYIRPPSCACRQPRLVDSVHRLVDDRLPFKVLQNNAKCVRRPKDHFDRDEKNWFQWLWIGFSL